MGAEINGIPLDILRCPSCGKETLVMAGSAQETYLTCGLCASSYPIVKKIPRLLRPGQLTAFSRDYPDFYSSLTDSDLKAGLPKPAAKDAGNIAFKGLNAMDYHQTRSSVATVRYSLKRRIGAIVSAISGFPRAISSGRILEMGCADGLISRTVCEKFNPKFLCGIDIQDDQLVHYPYPVVQGDCLNMPFRDRMFDLVFGAALIEHLPDPVAFISETCRILDKNGVLILTFPDPFYDFFCSITGYFRNAKHLHRFSIGKICSLMEESGFSEVHGCKFMLSPFESRLLESFEPAFENTLFRFLLMNQIIYGIKEKT